MGKSCGRWCLARKSKRDGCGARPFMPSLFWRRPFTCINAMKPSDSVEAFVSCPLQVERELLREISEVRPLLMNPEARFITEVWETRPVQGGVHVKTSYIATLQLNYWLKLAHRVLLRVGNFQALSLPRLRARLQGIDFRPYWGDRDFRLKVEAGSCRISNEKLIRRLCGEIWPVADPVPDSVSDSSSRTVLVRGWRDDWTVSVDTSGAHLHQRGYRKKSGPAPLRETLAALTWRLLAEDAPVSKLREVQILDPMAGSGTLLREAFDLYRPQMERDFLFSDFANCPKLLRGPQQWANHRLDFSTFQRGAAIDKDVNLAAILKENLSTTGFFQRIGDFAKVANRNELGLEEERELWIAANPPYGERLAQPAKESWRREWWPFVERMNPRRLAVWLPEKEVPSFLRGIPPADRQRQGQEAHSVRQFAISNGGIPCRILLFNRTFPQTSSVGGSAQVGASGTSADATGF
ncbi:MAG: hypothetical protein C5B49_10475 [Bdellovibrio sp.]|nr:MAG: hypothetical protein C5B49_10475 [Bdellovibrio sp.]